MRRISKILLMASSFLGVAIALYILIIGQVFKADIDTFFLGRVSFYLVAAIHKIFVAQKPITFRWWEECHAPFYP